MSGALEGIYNPGVVDPGVPVANPTAPFWQSSPHPLAYHQSSWPKEVADVLRIVLIKAHSLCSGATGKNDGHIKTMTFAMWEERKASFGIDEAVRISEFEFSHLRAMADAIHQDGLVSHCDLQLTEGIEVYYSQPSFDKAVEALSDMRVHVPHLAAEHRIYTGDKLARLQQSLNLSPRCVGAVGIPAASLWPYKWITGVLGPFIESGKVNVQTQTTVHQVVEEERNHDIAIVQTNRGEIRAKHVVHATNAWLGHLLPELQPYISPVRGNVVHYQASSASTTTSPLGLNHHYSYWLRYGDKDYDYLIQRKAGDIVVGRANTGRKATVDDSETDLAPMAHLRGFGDEVAAAPVPGSSAYITHAWSGILAFTQDGMPFAGRLPGRNHQWVCGGYHATGMIKAFRTAQFVAGLIAGGTPSNPTKTTNQITST
ncbi:FAD dependent oxidoreductase [Aspergillus sclerotiicarbonarius CBS 121057]|uniref:FAD dependent oxidoreductase n=1 Tax=Aspergillus sclerotiicarbonarius (strain CBS 121057 / IBT 28362) TaxID=1448318 RepID=A0A319E0R4_ASPSB|nr:FAD dependent oxidoreductase [Aspergillus sclerotiicarbonarius CBS 121057]